MISEILKKLEFPCTTVKNNYHNRFLHPRFPTDISYEEFLMSKESKTDNFFKNLKFRFSDFLIFFKVLYTVLPDVQNGKRIKNEFQCK